MADFDKAFDYLTPLEGGYSDDPDDRGGPTKYGISLNFYKDAVDQYATAEDIQDLTLERAKDLYYEFFWSKIQLGWLDSQPVADRLFALAVHAGPKQSVRVFQQALNESGWSLDVDGGLGPKTLVAANGTKDNPLVQDLRYTTWQFYKSLIEHRTQMQKFETNWRRRSLS